METAKICDINLIENLKKKKKLKSAKTNIDLIKKLYLIIDTIVDTDLIFTNINNLNNLNNLNNHNNHNNLKFLLLNFIENYININRNIKNINHINNEQNIIPEIIDELIDNVIFRCNNNEELVKEVVIMKKVKNDFKYNVKHISLISNR